MNGAELIAAERKRQIESEGWTAEHDDEHRSGEMAIAAACYAGYAAIVPERPAINERFVLMHPYANGFEVHDPWPWPYCDKRPYQDHGNVLADPRGISLEKRLDLLVKAGALIAAEIDRLQRNANPPGHEEEA